MIKNIMVINYILLSGFAVGADTIVDDSSMDTVSDQENLSENALSSNQQVLPKRCMASAIYIWKHL